MNLSQIIISKSFKEHPPAETKMNRCRDYFKENGKIDRDIIVSPDGILIDGYIAYLVLVENGVAEYDVKTMELSLYNQKKNYRHTETVYVYGCHKGKCSEYVWRITPHTKDVQSLHVGGKAMVCTKYGMKIVNVTNIRTLTEPPVKNSVKRVIQCLSG